MSQRKNGLDMIRPVIHIGSEFPLNVVGTHINAV